MALRFHGMEEVGVRFPVGPQNLISNKMNVLTHLAIIPDGNRRWAKQRKMPEFFGHREGAKTGEKILNAALDEGIAHLTFWGLSLDNIQKRSLAESKILFAIFEEQFEKLLTDKVVFEKEIRVNFIGRWRETFPDSLRAVMERAIEKTKRHAKHNLTFLMAYNGFDEMLEAIHHLKTVAVVDREAVKRHLWTKGLPPIDLVVRTGGEPHWSNGFMMWDTGDAHLYFTETLWPDFSAEELKKALNQFSKSDRRFGK